MDDPEWFEVKNSPEVIQSEKDHYILCFLLDLLQFIFQFVVTVKDEEASKVKRQPSAPIYYEEVKVGLFQFMAVANLESLIVDILSLVDKIQPSPLNLLIYSQ